MKSFLLRLYGIGCVAAAILAGCGGSQPPIGAPGAMPQSRSPQGGAGKALHRASGTGGTLIYVATWRAILYLTYPQMKIVGSLPEAYNYGGVCSDPNSGNLYAPQGTDIEVYAHGGTYPIAMLTPPTGYSELRFCSVDPETGDLAVSATGTQSKDTGAILIYPGGQGSAAIYSDKNMGFYGYPAYDNSGDVFFSADAHGTEELVKLVAAKNRFVSIKLNLGFSFDKIQWDGSYLDIEEFYGRGHGSEIAQVKIVGDVGTVANRINFYGAGSPSSFWISNGVFVNPLVEVKGRDNRGIGTWSYPDGGKVKAKAFGIAKGKSDGISDVTISVAPPR